MIESFLFSVPHSRVAPALVTALQRHGLDVCQSFDFGFAPEAHPGCACPHHGTPQCDCGFSVLLIYRARQSDSPPAGRGVEPAVLTLAGCNSQTQARLVSNAGALPDARLAQKVLAAVIEATGGLQALAAPAATATPVGV